jgi:hypothetical protein
MLSHPIALLYASSILPLFSLLPQRRTTEGFSFDYGSLLVASLWIDDHGYSASTERGSGHAAYSWHSIRSLLPLPSVRLAKDRWRRLAFSPRFPCRAYGPQLCKEERCERHSQQSVEIEETRKGQEAWQQVDTLSDGSQQVDALKDGSMDTAGFIGHTSSFLCTSAHVNI